MYVSSITSPLILITAPAVILNSAINSFCPLDTALVLTSDNFHSILPPLLLSSCPAPTLVALIRNCHMVPSLLCDHMYTLPWLRKTSVTVEMYQSNFHMFMCAFHPEISSYFDKSFHFIFIFNCVVGVELKMGSNL